eukprot:m.341067 g.341067  ORF g.341067 m.341067 type:complete len:351 (+) comp19778_c0_seq1:22-1074(+)
MMLACHSTVFVGTLAVLLASASAEGPCDILSKAGNPCVAAHSTVRALYGNYSGPLYKVCRNDGHCLDVNALAAGGFANVSEQDIFCSAGDCLIWKLYDQSPMGNHLTQRISCVPHQGCTYHQLVNASKHRIGVTGTELYGMWFDEGHGYNIDVTNGVAKGNEPESLYAVMSGTHYNGACCFDYGNSENNQNVPWLGHNGTMEAIYFGNAHWHGNKGVGDGPWAGADLEAGMYYGGGEQTVVNNQSTPLTSDFVSLHLKGRTDGFAIKGGDASQGEFKTMYDGVRPDPKLACCGGYQPMQKQGAIILGTGGDNSNRAVGNFYEGYIATGVTSDETDDAIQANIVSVGYKTL